jgi:predicted permease
MSMEGGGTPVRIWGYLATGNYFDVLGVQPLLGRIFTPDDDRLPGGHPIIVLSYSGWKRYFAADPAVIGRVVRINGLPFTVIGVMPPGFRGTELFFAPDGWVPMAMQAQIEPGNPWLERRQTHNVFVLGRLRPGVSRAQAEAAINALAAQLGREHPTINEGMTISLSPPGLAGRMLRGPVVGFSGALLAAATLVLLLACTNLAGVLLARTVDRQRDTAVCLALGARRADLVRQSLAESCLLSAGGTAAALLLTNWLAGVAAGWQLPMDFPLSVAVAVDYRVLLFSLGLALLAALLIGAAPALQATRADVTPALKDEVRGHGTGWHLRDGIVAAQIALSAVLLVGSLLVIRSLQQAIHVDLGFNPRGAVALRVDLGLQGYDEARGREFHRRVQERVTSLPGVTDASVSNSLPLSIDQSSNAIYIEGRPEPPAANVPRATYYQVSPGFFRTLQTRLVAGRDFDSRDHRQGLRVAIVNQAFVAQLLEGKGGVGSRFRSGRSGPWIEIVGVVQDGKYHSLGEAPKPIVFYPLTQWYNPTTTIVARASVPESEALELVKRAVHEIDPALSLFDDGSLSQLLALPMLPMRVAALALTTFGILAIVLVSVGTYALVSYGVARRTREICIRLAVGASSGQIVRLVLGRIAMIWAVGALIGAALMLASAPLLSPILLGVSGRDAATYALAIAMLLLVTAAACWLPTRRALVTDPAALLRSE